MNPTYLRRFALLALCALVFPVVSAEAQGVTSGAITGTVTDPQNQPVPGASVVAVHEPSGSRYESVSRADGRFTILGMRVGGPYTVTATLSGFQPKPQREVIVTLGTATDLVLTLSNVAVTEQVTVTAQSSEVFSSARTGAATTLNRAVLQDLPTISDRINDYARLSPQYSGGPFGGSFVGADNRLNNFTVDGSYFNNSFGLAGQPGERAGVTPISTAAVEEIQINVAPYDVRQGHFVGAGVNMVTRSGTNQFRGSAYYWFRDNDLVGTEAKGLTYNPGTFDASRYGAWVSGPILKDKLFFFGSYENDKFTSPGTTFRANTGGEPVGGSITRVLASDLDALSSYLKSNFGYETGPYQDYSFEVPAKRYLAKLDYNLNDRNKLSFRYLQLDSSSPSLTSNSSSLGRGTRRTVTDALNFANNNYELLENIKSGVAEWNSILGSNTANNLIVGYTTNDESRPQKGELFPMVDILGAGGTVYTTFGYEVFTPKNQLRYKTFQIQDNFTWSRGKHTFTFGGALERYQSDNVFFPGAQSAYVYNSLADFYKDANDYLANPNRVTSPVSLSIFQVRWSNIPGQEEPLQPLKVWFGGIYGQDEWQASRNLKLTYGLRLDMASFDQTSFENAEADAFTFRDENGDAVQYQTGKLPDANILWSPRVGFNWDVSGNRTTQVRGGTGVFTGPPLYVWISNQIGNTGVLTGFEDLRNTTARPWNPNPDTYKPTSVSGGPASSYELALTDPDFKFPQVWRTNLALDQRLPWGLTGTAEFIYSRDVNGIYYINANQPAAQTSFVGVDNRPRWTNNRINAKVPNAIVLKNQDEGYSWHVSAALQKSFRQGFLRGAYSYGEANNTVDPGSIAFGSFTGNAHSGDPNNPGLAYSSQFPGHRVFLAGSYRFEYLKFGATTFSFFWQGNTNGVSSYTFGADLNNDLGFNDLLYVHRDTSEMNFQTFTASGRTYTSAEQAAAWDAYIRQDSYLSQHRGEYAVRNAVSLPTLFRLDFSVAQDLFRNVGGGRHSLQIRADFLNFSNLLNHDWGVAQRLVNSQPLTNPSVDAEGRMLYRLRVVNNELMSKSLETTTSQFDVYRIQFSFRYGFN